MTPQAILEKYGPREAMEYDVLVIGAGPGGLATAIRIKQLAAEQSKWTRLTEAVAALMLPPVEYET